MYNLASNLLSETYSTSVKCVTFRPSLPICYHTQKFKVLLMDIENHVPQCLQPHRDPRGEISKLYQSFASTTVLDKGWFLVIVSIPLLDKFIKCKIFDILACLNL